MNIFVEFIEIYINQTIYLRGVYPRQVFKKHKAYALPVYRSIYPPLNDYLSATMKTIQHLLQTNELRKIEVLIFNESDKESFMIDIIKPFSVDESDKFLLHTHDIFRQSIYDLETKCKLLRKFSRSSKFKILLHTSEKAYQKLYSETLHQDFLWLKQEEGGEGQAESRELLPISSSANRQAFMSLYVEQ